MDKQIMHKKLSRPISTIFFVLTAIITSCGTLEVGLEPDAVQNEDGAISTPAKTPLSDSPTSFADNVIEPTTPTPVAVTNGMLELVTYVHPKWGYQIDIPNAATIDEDISGTLFIRQDNNEHMLLGVGVTVITHWKEWQVTTPEEMLQYATAGTANPIFQVFTDNGNLVGAGTLVERNGRFGNTVCENVVEQHMVFIVGENGYMVSIMADSPSRCDVTKLPETAPIIDSLQIAAGT